MAHPTYLGIYHPAKAFEEGSQAIVCSAPC